MASTRVGREQSRVEAFLRLLEEEKKDVDPSWFNGEMTPERRERIALARLLGRVMNTSTLRWSDFVNALGDALEDENAHRKAYELWKVTGEVTGDFPGRVVRKEK